MEVHDLGSQSSFREGIGLTSHIPSNVLSAERCNDGPEAGSGHRQHGSLFLCSFTPSYDNSSCYHRFIHLFME